MQRVTRTQTPSFSITRLAVTAIALSAALLASGCAPEIGGRASFPVLSRTTLPNYYEPIATVDAKRCTHLVLFLVGWGDDANHEALVTDLLAEYKGDAIADAELTFHSIPAFFYQRSCARIKGTIVRRSGSVSPPPVAAAKSAEVSK